MSTTQDEAMQLFVSVEHLAAQNPKLDSECKIAGAILSAIDRGELTVDQAAPAFTWLVGRSFVTSEQRLPNTSVQSR